MQKRGTAAGLGKSLLLAAVIFSTVASVVTMGEVSGIALKFAVSIVFFLIALIASMIKYLLLDPQNRI